jgi:phage-related protein
MVGSKFTKSMSLASCKLFSPFIEWHIGVEIFTWFAPNHQLTCIFLQKLKALEQIKGRQDCIGTNIIIFSVLLGRQYGEK